MVHLSDALVIPTTSLLDAAEKVRQAEGQLSVMRSKLTDAQAEYIRAEASIRAAKAAMAIMIEQARVGAAPRPADVQILEPGVGANLPSKAPGTLSDAKAQAFADMGQPLPTPTPAPTPEPSKPAGSVYTPEALKNARSLIASLVGDGCTPEFIAGATGGKGHAPICTCNTCLRVYGAAWRGTLGLPSRSDQAPTPTPEPTPDPEAARRAAIMAQYEATVAPTPEPEPDWSEVWGKRYTALRAQGVDQAEAQTQATQYEQAARAGWRGPALASLTPTPEPTPTPEVTPEPAAPGKALPYCRDAVTLRQVLTGGQFPIVTPERIQLVMRVNDCRATGDTAGEEALYRAWAAFKFKSESKARSLARSRIQEAYNLVEGVSAS